MLHRPAHYARLSMDAYEPIRRHRGFSFDGVECLRHVDEGETVFAFRGTTRNYEDILTDMRGVPWYDPRVGWCHSGFLKKTRSFWGRWLRDQVERAREAGSRIVLTGHSLGGAEATIAAALAIVELRAPVGLITFGSPRVGFCSRLREIIAPRARVLRYVRGKDIVPRVPPISGILRRSHVDTLIPWRHVPEDCRRIGQPVHLFRDHMIAGYVADLDRES